VVCWYSICRCGNSTISIVFVAQRWTTYNTL
jgi:hypothetical protein